VREEMLGGLPLHARRRTGSGWEWYIYGTTWKPTALLFNKIYINNWRRYIMGFLSEKP